MAAQQTDSQVTVLCLHLQGRRKSAACAVLAGLTHDSRLQLSIASLLSQPLCLRLAELLTLIFSGRRRSCRSGHGWSSSKATTRSRSTAWSSLRHSAATAVRRPGASAGGTRRSCVATTFTPTRHRRANGTLGSRLPYWRAARWLRSIPVPVLPLVVWGWCSRPRLRWPRRCVGVQFRVGLVLHASRPVTSRAASRASQTATATAITKGPAHPRRPQAVHWKGVPTRWVAELVASVRTASVEETG